jgi:hypothetical protein
VWQIVLVLARREHPVAPFRYPVPVHAHDLSRPYLAHASINRSFGFLREHEDFAKAVFVHARAHDGVRKDRFRFGAEQHAICRSKTAASHPYGREPESALRCERSSRGSRTVSCDHVIAMDGSRWNSGMTASHSSSAAVISMRARASWGIPSRMMRRPGVGQACGQSVAHCRFDFTSRDADVCQHTIVELMEFADGTAQDSFSG